MIKNIGRNNALHVNVALYTASNKTVKYIYIGNMQQDEYIKVWMKTTGFYIFRHSSIFLLFQSTEKVKYVTPTVMHLHHNIKHKSGDGETKLANE